MPGFVTSPDVARVLGRLSTPDAVDAWREFLDAYAALILHGIRLEERDRDDGEGARVTAPALDVDTIRAPVTEPRSAKKRQARKRAARRIAPETAKKLLLPWVDDQIPDVLGLKATPRQTLESKYTDVLLADVAEAHRLVSSDGSPYNRRNCVRCAFAAIEGMNFYMKQVCLSFSDVRPNLYSDAELLMLREQTVSLNQRGEPVVRPYYPSFAQSLRFTLSMVRRCFRSNIEPDYSGKDWKGFQDAVAIRDGLTHPKSDDSLSVSDEELTTVMNAYGWYIHAVMGTVVRAIKAFMVGLQEAGLTEFYERMNRL